MELRRIVCLALLLLSCRALSSSDVTIASVQVPTSNDKKLFEEFIDVGFTKTRLASEARKAKRLEDLQDLAARMVRQFIKMLEEEGIKVENTDKVLKDLQHLLDESQSKRNVLGANIYATYQFRLNFYNCKDKAFEGKVKSIEKNTPFSSILATVKATIERKGEKFTARSFKQYVQQYPASSSLKDLKDKITLTESDIIHCFEEALREFNSKFIKVIDSILAVGKLSAKLPVRPLTIDYIRNYNEEWQCAICTEPLEPVLANLVITPCKHVFHKNCLDDWKAKRKAAKQQITCPVCRQKI